MATTKKLTPMEMGGLYSGMISSDVSTSMPEPVSGYGTMDTSADKPKKPKGYNYKAHQARGQKAFKNRGKCGRKGC